MMRFPVALAIVLSVSVFAAGCGGDSGTSPSPTSSAPYSQTDLRVGTGADATAGRRATVNYTLWLYDAGRAENKGTQIETSVGGAPFAFTLGAGGVIRGWDQGVVGMKVGGVRRLVLPPELAYGSAGSPPKIPGNATLLFEIELLGIQ